MFSKLLSIAHNMMEFQIDKKQIQSLISVFAKQYSVDDCLEKQIITMIEEIVYDDKKPFNEKEDLTEDPLGKEIVTIERNTNLKITKPTIIEEFFTCAEDSKGTFK